MSGGAGFLPSTVSTGACNTPLKHVPSPPVMYRRSHLVQKCFCIVDRQNDWHVGRGRDTPDRLTSHGDQSWRVTDIKGEKEGEEIHDFRITSGLLPDLSLHLLYPFVNIELLFGG